MMENNIPLVNIGMSVYNGEEHLRLAVDSLLAQTYIVASNGIMQDLHDVPRGKPEWINDNPSEAALEFASQHPEFVIEQSISVDGSGGQAVSASRPFFSIGVATYERREFLKQALTSITRQTFPNFEIIVGNNSTQEVLSADLLGIEDPRIRFVNHPQNLGPIRNMNSLLTMGRGRYFTWLADDDLLTPDFLHAVYAALIKCGFPPCIFTSYMTGATYSDDNENSPVGEPRLLTGRQFLQEYLARSLKTIGCYAVFDIEYLKRIGGMEQLSNRFSPYSDNLLVIRSGLLEKVVYIDAPLVFFRTHDQSTSWTSPDVDEYSSAQEELCRKCVDIFRREGLRDDFHSNLFLLLRWCIGDFANVVLRSGFAISRRQIIGYMFFLKSYIGLLKGSAFFWRAIRLAIMTVFRQVWHIGKQALLRTLPAWAKHPARRARELWRRAAR